MKQDTIHIELIQKPYSAEAAEDNGWPVGGTSLDAKCYINGKEINQCFDIIPFLRSIVNKEHHEVFTCSCGIAGCAGIFEGVHVKHRKHSVEWRIPKEEKKGYDFLDKMFYSFSREAYEAERKRVYEAVVTFAKTQQVVDQFYGASTLNTNLRWYKEAFEGKSHIWW